MALHSLLSCLLIGILYHVALAVPQGNDGPSQRDAISRLIANVDLSAPLNAITESPSVLQTALPDLEGPNTAEPSCGGCYLVADVAGLVRLNPGMVNRRAKLTRHAGVVLGNLPKYSSDSNSISGRRKWHKSNENLRRSRCGRVYLQSLRNNARHGSIDPSQF